jgi:hypothetical protein
MPGWRGQGLDPSLVPVARRLAGGLDGETLQPRGRACGRVSLESALYLSADELIDRNARRITNAVESERVCTPRHSIIESVRVDLELALQIDAGLDFVHADAARRLALSVGENLDDVGRSQSPLVNLYADVRVVYDGKQGITYAVFVILVRLRRAKHGVSVVFDRLLAKLSPDVWFLFFMGDVVGLLLGFMSNNAKRKPPELAPRIHHVLLNLIVVCQRYSMNVMQVNAYPLVKDTPSIENIRCFRPDGENKDLRDLQEAQFAITAVDVPHILERENNRQNARNERLDVARLELIGNGFVERETWTFS